MRKTRLKCRGSVHRASAPEIVRNSASFDRPNSAMSATGRGSAQLWHRSANEQHLGQIVLCLVLPRIDQRRKSILQSVQKVSDRSGDTVRIKFSFQRNSLAPRTCDSPAPQEAGKPVNVAERALLGRFAASRMGTVGREEAVSGLHHVLGVWPVIS